MTRDSETKTKTTKIQAITFMFLKKKLRFAADLVEYCVITDCGHKYVKLSLDVVNLRQRYTT